MSKTENGISLYVINVNKAKSLKQITLPCLRLEKRLLEILAAAKLPADSYEFTIYYAVTPKASDNLKLCSIKAYLSSTIYFTINVIIDREYFEVSLKVPSKYRDDNLVFKLKKAENTINNLGWDKEESPTRIF